MKHLPKTVLGISFGHGDSSACLIYEGSLVAAAEEERFSRIKHDASFPILAIDYCLKQGGVSPKEVEVVAIAKKRNNAFWQKLSFTAQNPGQFFAKKEKSKVLVPQSLRSLDIKPRGFFYIEHHLAHMYSSYILNPLEQGAFLTWDGLGDFVSCALGTVQNKKIEVLDRVYFPNSAGYFYTAMTQYLGFPYYGDEFKVMGLSSYGKPTFVRQMENLLTINEPFGFTLNQEAFPVGSILKSFTIRDRQPKVEPFFKKNYLIQCLGIPPRRPNEHLTQAHFDIAKSVQVHFENVGNHLLNHLATLAKGPLYLAGGCSHNSVWVGKIPQHTPFNEIYVAPASHDAGIAVGAAAAACGSATIRAAHPALLGPEPSFKNVSFNKIKDQVIEQPPCSEEALIEFLVKELQDRKIIGLCRGRLEFGPRALGSRSIVVDPRLAEMKDILNRRVKHRESFRPFAASVLWDHQNDWFENSFYSPTMEAVFDVKANQRERVPAVVHVDGTCRIQSVRKETDLFYYKLIEAFRKKTGVPMLLNTSFNDSEPIVCTIEDAFRCFLNTEMDHLVVNHTIYTNVLTLKAAS